MSGERKFFFFFDSQTLSFSVYLDVILFSLCMAQQHRIIPKPWQEIQATESQAFEKKYIPYAT